MIPQISSAIEEKKRILNIISNDLIPDILTFSKDVSECLIRGNGLLWCGNGGSAADCEHLSAELTGRFQKERKSLRSIAITSSSAAMSAVANDYGFHDIFRRQVEALSNKRDILICMSTSGNSKNIIEAVKEARRKSIQVICLLGCDGGELKGKGDHQIIIPSTNTARIQEAHMFIGHLMCEIVEETVFNSL